MSRALLVAAASTLVLAVSAAGAPPRATSVTLAAPVVQLAADATGVAVHTRAANGCDTILLWHPAARPTGAAPSRCRGPRSPPGRRTASSP